VRIIGLDHGSRRIGVAIGDTETGMAFARAALRRRNLDHDLALVGELCTTEGAGLVVIGLPLNMDGSEGPRCQSVRQFATNLLKLKDLPILFWDERMSTMAIERAMIAHDVTRARRDKVIDQAAAAFILQGALDAIGRTRE